MNTPIESGPESAHTAAWARFATLAGDTGVAASLAESVEARKCFAGAGTEPTLQAARKGIMQVTTVRD